MCVLLYSTQMFSVVDIELLLDVEGFGDASLDIRYTHTINLLLGA